MILHTPGLQQHDDKTQSTHRECKHLKNEKKEKENGITKTINGLQERKQQPQLEHPACERGSLPITPLKRKQFKRLVIRSIFQDMIMGFISKKMRVISRHCLQQGNRQKSTIHQWKTALQSRLVWAIRPGSPTGTSKSGRMLVPVGTPTGTPNRDKWGGHVARPQAAVAEGFGPGS